MLIVVFIGVFCFVGQLAVARSYNDEFPTCGDCWCVPDNGGLDPCPSNKPQTEFSESVLNAYKVQKPQNPFELFCNPYTDKACTTTPAQILTDSDEAVCAFHYEIVNSSYTTCQTYSLITYPTRSAAESAGDIVTHVGSCGLCSTTQDLAIYLNEDFTSAGKICATKGLFNEEVGLECYMDIGLTKECAKIWNYDGIYDGKACGAVCAQHVSDPNNGPVPECELNECLQCDEDKAGPLFSLFGGRTRRRSGLLSEIVRNCSSIATITHNPCLNPSCGC